MISLIFLFSCSDELSKSSKPTDSDNAILTEDSAQPDPLDCSPNDSEFPGLEILSTAVPTLPKIQWEGEAAVLLYTDAMGKEREISSQTLDDNHHVVHPLGFRANAVYSGQLVRRNGDDIVACSSILELRTQALPSSFPEMDTTYTQAGDDGFIVTSIMGLESSFITVFDAEGEVIWVLEQSNTIPEGSDFPIKVVAYDPYKNRLVFNRWQNSEFCDINGYVSWFGWDGEQHERWGIEGLRVGMTQIGDGQLAVLRCEKDSTGFEEDVLSIATSDGITDIWRATDSFPDVSDSPIELSWVHANFLHAVSPDVLLVSMERIQSVGAFNIESRAFEWLLSGKSNAGDYETSESLVHRPHALVPYDAGYLIYNRGSTEVSSDECAHVRYVELDDENQMAHSPWKIDFDPCGPLGFFGDVFTSENHIIVIWSDRGQLNYYNLEQSIDLQVNLPLGYAFTFGGYISWSDISTIGGNSSN